MTKEIATVQQPGAGAVMAPKTIVELAQSKAVVQHMLKAIMKGPSEKNPLGVHYGIIPGTPKPTLFKAGSEIILSTFRIAVDFEVEDLSSEDCIRYRVKAIGRLPDGSVVGYGAGECSTDEEKYRWKKPVCDEEWNDTDPSRRREKYGKGQGGKPYKTKQIRTFPADLANTVLKMAKKRAQIDLALTATGASDVFDQDLEDLKDVIDVTDYQRQAPAGGKPDVKQPEATGSQGSDGGQRQYTGKIKPGGAKIVRDALQANGVTEKEFCDFMKIPSVDELLSEDMTRGMNAIKKGEILAQGRG